MPQDDMDVDAGRNSEGEEDVYPTFPSPFAFNTRQPITLVELRMRNLSGMIRQKPRWWEKIQDHELVAKWRAEMVEYDRVARVQEWGDEQEYSDWGPKRWPLDALTDAQLDYVFAELQYDARHLDKETGIHATLVPGVYQSASLIPAALKWDLIQGVAHLENVPEDQKDWHPGSNRQVLDLVHPSLYCFRLGKSLVHKAQITRGVGEDPLTTYPLESYLEDRDNFSDLEKDDRSRAVSKKFQWLPTVFDVSETGEVEQKSYINNLHPIKHASLYPSITSILQHFIPMFEKVLSDAASPEPNRVIEVDPCNWYPPDTDFDEVWDENRWPVIPECPTFAPPTEEGRVDVNLKGRRIRVIIKLASIVLTPESPSYPGGSWHVEGMANENIVATGLYYYSSENITESRLAFRMQVGSYPMMDYQHDDYQGWLGAFGFSNDDPLNQEFGHIIAEEGKCVAFPNTYQHRVEPFALADPSRPGHRKILAFFLTDPYNVVQSTMMVPPQQREWYLDEMERIPGMRELPQELFDIIADYALEGTITRAEAEADREKLMEERTNFVIHNNRNVFEVNFSLCEH